MSPDDFESSLETTNLDNKEADVPAVEQRCRLNLYCVFAVSFIWDVYSDNRYIKWWNNINMFKYLFIKLHFNKLCIVWYSLVFQQIYLKILNQGIFSWEPKLLTI